MCKKVLIAALAVVIGLAVVSSTRLGSHLRLRWKRATDWASRQVRPEDEVARLRMELANLARQDDQHYDKVARMAVDVDSLRKDVNQQKDNLTKLEKRIRALRGELANKAEFVVYNDQRFSREDAQRQFDRDVDTFRVAEEAVKSRETTLKAKEKLLHMERDKLSKLQAEREKMAADLQTLETLLAEERQAQAARESSIDDSGYRKVRKDMNTLRERIEVLKKKRQLRGETLGGPIEEAEKTQHEKAQRDKYIEARFGKTDGSKETVKQ
jgi:hypothetical protein